MSICNTWKTLYNNVIKNDLDSQKYYLNLIAEQVRNIPLEYLMNEQALFIPNDDYVSAFAGDSALYDENGFYYGGVSTWSDNVIFPIRSLNNDAQGIGGFNPRLYLYARETQDYSVHYYTYSAKSLFSKGDYLFWGIDGFQKAYHDGYVILVDGMFDAIQLRGLGFNAAGLMGSTLTESIIAQLRFIKRKIVISDNDAAGLKLEYGLKKALRECVALHQGFDKDVDGAIKNGYDNAIINELKNMINEPIAIDHTLINKH